MTSHSLIELTLEQSLHAAIADVNRWRGHCLELHARLERAVNAVLRHWRPAGPLPQKFADRLKQLHRLTKAGGPHHNEGLSTLVEQLQKLRSEWRDRLAHATSTVHLNEARDWVWHFSMARPGGDTEDCGAITRSAAVELEEGLGKAVNALRSRLRKLQIPNCC